MVEVLSPTTPTLFEPHAQRLPSFFNAKACSAPAAIWGIASVVACAAIDAVVSAAQTSAGASNLYFKRISKGSVKPMIMLTHEDELQIQRC